GALQKCNRMDVASLLNPQIEAQLIEMTSDEEIFLAVQHAAHEDGLESGPPLDEDEEPEPQPTRREALQAAALLTRYSNTLNDPLARKLEDILRQFGRQLSLDAQRNMRERSITDYFR
ncbi:hypothetical protein BV20DRAFT_922220, partial [Pilatotrama ljubarskyi]